VIIKTTQFHLSVTPI